jgi:hypothetical protein
MGQVHVGFLPRNGAQTAAVAIAVFLSQPLAALPAAASADGTAGTPPKAAATAAPATTHHYAKIISLD